MTWTTHLPVILTMGNHSCRYRDNASSSLWAARCPALFRSGYGLIVTANTPPGGNA